MAKATFTARWVESVGPPEKGQEDYFDTKPPGVGLRITNSGRKTWFVMYRSGGRLRRLTLGTYPTLTLAEARSQATGVKLAVAQGRDPATQKQDARTAPTVADLVAQYLEMYAKVRRKSWRYDELRLKRNVLPQWGNRKATDITRRDVIALLDLLMARDVPIEANRTHAIIRALFNWAISRDLLEYNPCTQVKAPGKEQQRDRVLTDEEVRAVWDACGHLDPVLEVHVKLRLLTAQRGNEIRTMRWEDLELDTGWWTIPAHITKNGLSHRVPLNMPAQEMLQTVRMITGNGQWVFPSRRHTAEPFVNMQKPMCRVREISGVSFVWHDLHRTAASHMTSMGIPRLVVSKILNHVEPGVTRVYDRHSYDAEKREALEMWGRKVMELVNRNP